MRVSDTDLNLSDSSNSLTESLLPKEDHTKASAASTSVSCSTLQEKEELMSKTKKREPEGGTDRDPLLILNPIPVPDNDIEQQQQQQRQHEEQEAFTTQVSWDRGEKQESRFRDLPFALLFYAQFTSIVILALAYAIPFIRLQINSTAHEVESQHNPQNKYGYGYEYLYPLLTAFGTTTLFMILSLITMKKMGKQFILFSLWCNVLLSFFMGIVALSVGRNTIIALLTFLSSLIGCFYVCAVQNRIPFAAANLQTGIKALGMSIGGAGTGTTTADHSVRNTSMDGVGGFLVMVGSAYITGLVLMGWILLWMASLYWIMGVQHECDYGTAATDAIDDRECQWEITNESYRAWIFLFVLCLYWTQQVSKNIVHTTVAGVVGTWYFDPFDPPGDDTTTAINNDDNDRDIAATSSNYCGGRNRRFVACTTVCSSLFRTLTFSFGSVCLGSLLVAIVHTLRFIVAVLKAGGNNDSDTNANNNSGGGRAGSSGGNTILYCILDCILALFQSLLEYFNKWAFIYVGLYGYPYITAGKKVMTLFRQRGFTIIINDNLVSNALDLTSFTIGLLAGTSGYVLFTAKVEAFIIGFAVGLLLSLTMMGVIDSAVNTIVICFSEAPNELERNHPDESNEMKQAWRSVYNVRC